MAEVVRPASGPHGAGAGLIDYEATLDCIHCGLCLPHCPTYQETGRESSSPRGRIYLMRGVAEQRIELDAGFAQEMSDCLACRACESACPAGVRYGHLVETARAEVVARGQGGGRMQRLLLRWVVARPATLRLLAAALRAYQRTGLQDWLRRSRLLRLTAGMRRAEALLPRLRPVPRFPIVRPPQGARRGRVALFRGCVMPVLFGDAEAATVEVLAANGFEVVIPPGQRCCGALHAHSGDVRAARRLRERNRAVFRTDSLDAVVTNSAGCGATLKAGADGLANKTRDVCEFLAEAGLRPPPTEVRLRVGYDDPCHLLHGQGISEAPRQLLAAIPGLELVDLPGHRDCCGAAGTYNLTHPEMSDRLLERKVEAVRQTGVDVVASGNPGCLMQIGAGLRTAGLRTLVVHPVELLARAYRPA